MLITYKPPDIPEPGENDLIEGINEINKKNYEKAQTYFEKSATYGHEYGQLFCALIHFGGFDISKRNPEKALEYFKAVESSSQNKIAQYFIGQMYISGDGVKKHCCVGWEWIFKSAENDCMRAKVFLTEEYPKLAKNPVQVFTYYKQIVESDVYNSDTLCLFENLNFQVKFDYDEIIRLTPVKTISYLKLLLRFPNLSKTNGFTSSYLWYNLTNNPYIISFVELTIGICYFNEIPGIKQDFDKSLYYFLKAAKHQTPEAYRYIACQYEEGDGVDQDYLEASKNHLKAISLGDVESMLCLATLYYDGKGVDKNHVTALSYLEKYLEHNRSRDKGSAYLYIGSIFRDGKNNIEQDSEAAVRYLEMALENGRDVAALRIAEMYAHGIAVKEDRKKAAVWFLKAASLKYYQAYYHLGYMEFLGSKNRKDLSKALNYFCLAEEHGIAEAKKMIERITLLLFKELQLSI